MSSWSFLWWFLLCHIKASPPPPSPPILILSWGLKNSTWLGGAISEFSHTRRRQWARSLMSSGPVQGRRRSLPEGMLSHTCPTYAVTLSTCKDFSEDAVVKSPPPPLSDDVFSFHDVLAAFCSDAVQEKKAIQVLGGHFSIGVISSTVNGSISLNP